MNHDSLNTCFYFFFFFWGGGGGLHNAARPVKSRAPPVNQQLSETQSAACSLAAEKRPRPLSGNAAAVTQSADASSVQQPSSPQPSSASPGGALPPAASVSGVAPSAVTHDVVTSLSPSAAAVHARFGRTSKYATKDTPRTLGVKCVVDFEKIYRYLSEIHKPDKEFNLTPMGKSKSPHSYKLETWTKVVLWRPFWLNMTVIRSASINLCSYQGFLE